MERVPPHRPAQHGRIMVGMVMMAAGVLILAERLNLAEVYLTSQLWPLLPLGLGLLRMIDPPVRSNGCAGSRRSGAWLVFVGCWGLANELHVYGLDYDNSWPLVLVFAGLAIVWGAMEQPSPAVEGERRQP